LPSFPPNPPPFFQTPSAPPHKFNRYILNSCFNHPGRILTLFVSYPLPVHMSCIFLSSLLCLYEKMVQLVIPFRIKHPRPFSPCYFLFFPKRLGLGTAPPQFYIFPPSSVQHFRFLMLSLVVCSKLSPTTSAVRVSTPRIFPPFGSPRRVYPRSLLSYQSDPSFVGQNLVLSPPLSLKWPIV